MTTTTKPASKHWYIAHDEAGAPMIHSDLIERFKETWSAGPLPQHPKAIDQRERNARLLAAAPTLLEACQVAEARLYEIMINQNLNQAEKIVYASARNMIRAAIAQALGQ